MSLDHRSNQLWLDFNLHLYEITFSHVYFKEAEIFGLCHRKCLVRSYMHELFVSKTRTSEVRASEGF